MLKTSSRKTVDIFDWNELVSKTYGRPYNFQQQDGCKDRGVHYLTISKDMSDQDELENDTVPEVINHSKMGVSFKAWLTRDPKQPVGDRTEDWSIGLWWERNFYPSIEMVASDLCKRGLVEEGEYMIVIDW